MSVSVTNSGGTILIDDTNSVIYPDKNRVDVTAQGTNVTIRWSPVHYVTYPATEFTSPTGTASQIAAAIAAFLDSGAEVTGSGTTNYIPKWSAATALTNSLLFDNGTTVQMGGTSAIASAAFAITSTTQGILLPRMTTTQQNNIASPATALLIFNTTTGLFQYYTGAAWVALDTGTNDYTQGGNAFATTGTLGLTDANILNIITNNATRISIASAGEVGIGMTPSQLLDVGRNQNSSTLVGVTNTTSGTSSVAGFTMTSNVGSGSIAVYSSTHTNPVVRNATAISSTGGNLLLQPDTSFYTYLLNGFVGVNVTPPTAPVATVEITQYIATSGSPTAIRVNGAAHTTIAASEVIDVNYNLARTVQFTGGTGFGTQRAFLIQPPTYAFVSATGTITTAASLAISGAPVAGTNAIISNSLALWVQSGESRFVGSGTGSTTFSVRAYNSTPTLMFSVRNDGYISAGLANGSTTIGLGAGFNDTLADNTFIGVNVGTAITTGILNTAIGSNALNANTTGNNNTAVGYLALSSNTIATNNTAVGNRALRDNISGDKLTAIGQGALASNTTGINNTAIGYFVLVANTTGTENTSIGVLSLSANTTGSNNMAFGRDALIANTTGGANVAIGRQSLSTNITGSNNVAVGHAALLTTTGDSNVAIGFYSGFYETGSNSFYVNNQDRANTTNDKTFSLIYGVFNAAVASQTLRFNAFTGINMAPVAMFDVTQVVATTGSPTALRIIGAAHTTLTLGTEAIDINFNLARTVQFAAGALTTQRAFLIQAPAYAFAAGSTLTTAASLAISGAPQSQTNATITESHAILVQAGAVQPAGTVTRSYGLTVNAQTGASSNYSAAFLGGNVGIGTATPTAELHLAAGTATASTSPLKFTSGTSLTTAEAGAMEFTTDDLFFTITTGAARKRLLMADAVGGLTSTRVPFATTNGRLTDSANMTYVTNRLSPTYITLAAGTATAGTAPLVFTSGTSLTTAIAGAMEFTTDDLFFTITTGAARKNITLWDTLGTSTRVPFATTNGRLTDSANMTYVTDRLSPTYITLAAGTATAGTAPLVLTSGTSLTTAIAGAMEFTTDDLFFTITTGAARKRLLMADAVGGLTSGRVPFVTTNGRLLDDASLLYALAVGLTIAPPAAATGVRTNLIVTLAANTNQTLSTEISSVNFNLSATREWAAGAITTQREFLIQAPTYAFVAASTITNAATLAITAAPTAGTNATLTNSSALWIQAGAARLDGRLIENQGADIASANNLTLGSDGNTFEITGTTQINLISNIGWRNGSVITLVFNESLTVANGTTTSGTNVTIRLAASEAFTATANDTLTLVLCETTANGQAWRELARTAI